MRALITGINGFVGVHLAEHLLASGDWEVAGLARGELRHPHLRERVTLVAADMLDADGVLVALERVRPHVIFHLAGQAFVPAAFDDPAATISSNLLGLVHIIQAMMHLRLNTRVLVIGSGEVYGRVQPHELPLTEDAPFRPANPYAFSKAAQDMLALQYFYSHQLPLIRLRPFNHLGPGQDDRFVASAFASQIARIEAGLQEPLMRVGNLAAQRDFTDVRDVVRAYRMLALAGVPGEAYNVCSGQATAISRLLEILLTLTPVPIEVQLDSARMRPSDVPIVVGDYRRLQFQTGWHPEISLEQTLADLLAYWRARLREPA